MNRKPMLLSLFLAAAVAVLPATAIDVAFFEDRVTTEQLDNGLTILIYERPTAPVVSFFTHVDVGAAQEVAGITGLCRAAAVKIAISIRGSRSAAWRPPINYAASLGGKAGACMPRRLASFI